MKATTVTFCSCLMLAGCVAPPTRWEPIVDGGRGTPKYTEDLVACQAYVDTQADPAEAGANAGLLGAAIGLLASDLLGGNGTLNAATAAGTGVASATAAAGTASTARQQIMRNCMIGRGHKVLN